jgi:hypothetical protein
MKMEYNDYVWDARVISALAKRLGPAARHHALEALGQTHGLELIVHSEPVLPPGWERRLSDGRAPKSYFIHSESGQISPFPPPLEPTPDKDGESTILSSCMCL